MLIGVTVQLAENESLADTADAAAVKVLAALGGDLASDTCTVTITAPMVSGLAGIDPATGTATE